MVDGISRTGSAGIQKGFENAARHSKEIVSASQSEGDTLAPAIELNNDARQVQASAKVVKIADELNGAVLDIVA